MTDRERLEAILITAYDPPKTASQRRLFGDMKWLTDTLKKYIDRCESEEIAEGGRTTTSYDFDNATFPRT